MLRVRSCVSAVKAKPYAYTASRSYAQDYRIRRVLRIPKEHMYSAISNVDKYKEFVPYCIDSNVTSTDDHNTKALLKVGWKDLEEEFESTVSFEKDQVIAYAADNQMFQHLQCEWTVTEVKPDQCLTALTLSFKFRNPLYDFIAQSAGNLVSKKMIEAFSKRGAEIAAKAKRSGESKN